MRARTENTAISLHHLLSGGADEADIHSARTDQHLLSALADQTVPVVIRGRVSLP
ncbi:hypothetical protein EV191_115107 [Tamaricihabitans halophyticus]|uniref:Uncharacterized protein n=1 Tax=Tamaricihabitans halophyticus TaxID=1262583 RepID=A0A4R2QA64_9PSEU|nr:hypothetical protein EV191_115107 [Tamaricihabitans halophyticus]